MADKRISQLIERTDIANNDVLPIVASGATTTNKVTISTIQNWMQDNLDVGVTSVGITLGTSGNDVNVTGSPITTSGNITINIPTATATIRGVLSPTDWNTFNNKVPYTGAVSDVDLGQRGIEARYFSLETSPATLPGNQGAIYWDTSKSTAALIMNGTTQHIGQDTFFYVKNSTGSTIPKGTGVGFAGTDGASGHLLISPFLANGSQPSTYFMGVTAEAITNGGFGQVMQFGELSGVNTSGYSSGALLYASTSVAGAFQTTAPQAPNNIILVAAAVNSTNNGSIIVRPQIGSNIKNDEGVKITSVADKDLLQYKSSTGLWENTSFASLGYVPYTGANAGVNLGTNPLSASQININGASPTGGSYLGFKHSTSVTTGTDGYTSIYTFGTNNIGFQSVSGTNIKDFTLSMVNITPNVPGGRVYNLPDASGTLALTSNIPANIVTGTLATGQVAFGTAANTVGGDNGLFWDNTNKRLGIGSIIPISRIHISGNSAENTQYSAERVASAIGSSTQLLSLTAIGQIPTLTSSSANIRIIGDATWSSTSSPSRVQFETTSVGSTTVTERWRITSAGILQSNGAQTIQTSTGNLTLATAAGNGNIVLSPHGTGAVTLTGALNGTSASFSSTLQAGGEITTGSVSRAFLRQTAGGDAELGCKTGGSTTIFSNGTAALTISSTGAATFSSSVTVQGSSLVVNGSGSNVAEIKTNSDANALVIVSSANLQDSKTRIELVGTTNSTAPDQIFYRANTHTFTGSNASLGARVTINNSGNVGIGTASPTTYSLAGRHLEVNDAGGGYAFIHNNTTSVKSFFAANESGALAALFTFSNHPLTFGTNNTERMRITSGGFTKSTNNGSYWSVSGPNHETVSNSNGSAINVDSHSGSDPYGTFIFFTGASPNNTTNYFLRCADSTINRLIIYSNGNVLNSNGSYGSFSDAKLKENIEDATPKLDDLMKVKVRNYNLIGDNKKQIGVIAQELEEVFPAMIDESEDFEEVEVPQVDEEGNEILNEEGEVVTTKERVSKGTTTKSVKYSVFVPMLIKAMQEQQEQIKSLTEQVEALKSQING